VAQTRQPQSRKSKPARSLRARALAILARREYSRQELERKLLPYADNPDEIPALLAEFEQRGWLSERRFAEELTATRSRRYGSQRIAHELREKGVSEEMISGALAGLGETEVAAARAVWQKKFGVVPANANEKARQIRFLQSRGFSFDTIRRILKSATDEEAG
jgi:regulatory protein